MTAASYVRQEGPRSHVLIEEVRGLVDDAERHPRLVSEERAARLGLPARRHIAG